MANFNVHLSAGIIGGTALAHIGWGMGVWPGESLFLVIMLTTIGGLLPDIDAHNSHSVKLIFNLFALITMVFVSTLLHGSYSFWMIALISACVFVGVRYGVSNAFLMLTEHRGNCHSLVAMLLAGFVTAAGSYSLQQNGITAWSHGFAVMVGVLIHLALDEIYAVDFAGVRLKKSFGTGMKVLSLEHPFSAVGFVVLAFIMAGLAPPMGDALTLITYIWGQTWH